MNRGSDLDSIVAEYERAFSLNSNTDIGQFVPDRSVDDYSEIVTELIRVELELSWSTKKRKTIQDYARLFPGVVEDPKCLDRIAFEEYRLRVASGESVMPHDYQVDYGINAYHWPVLYERNASWNESYHQGASDDGSLASLKSDSWNETQVDLAGRMFESHPASPPTVESTLHRRLRFISIAMLVSLLYLSILAIFNPVTKVGLFLGSPWLFWLNGCCLIGCLLICVILWSRKKIRLSNLRILETILFGSIVIELSCGLIRLESNRTYTAGGSILLPPQ